VIIPHPRRTCTESLPELLPGLLDGRVEEDGGRSGEWPPSTLFAANTAWREEARSLE
jgi:hypothetical protein